MSTKKTAEDLNPVEKMQQELNSLRNGTITYEPIAAADKHVEYLESAIDRYKTAGERDLLLIFGNLELRGLYNVDGPGSLNDRVKKLEGTLYRFYDTMTDDTRNTYFDTTDYCVVSTVLKCHAIAENSRTTEEESRIIEVMTKGTKINGKPVPVEETTINIDLPYGPTNAELKEEIAQKTETSTQYEYVNHPSHYNKYSMEVIDMMVKIWDPENAATFCEMNAYKYRMRLGLKPENPIDQDLKKEKWYLDKAKQIRKDFNLPDPPTKELF